jgi:hypothetical protein
MRRAASPRSASGRSTAALPPPKDKNGADVAAGTLHPLPGMQMKPGDAYCSTGSKEAIRAAAKASEAWADGPIPEAHWLRDAER